MKTRQVSAKLLHADRRIDGRADRHDETQNRFSQFCERRPKTEQSNQNIAC